MTATSGPGHRTSATYTVELLGSFGHTAEQATAAVAAALTVPLDRAQRLLAGKRFRITVTASPPSAEASAAVAKLLAGGVDLAVLDEETGERRELLAPRPKGTEGASRSGSGKLEPTGRFKFSLEGTEITGKPTSTTGLKPIRLVDPNPRPGAGGTSRPPESTARYSTQQLLGSTPDPGDTRKGASRSGMPPVVPQPPPSRTSTPPVASHPPSSRAPASTRDPASDAVDTGRSQRPSHLGLHPIADEPTGGRLPAVGEPTQRIGSRYYGSNGERAGSVPPAPPSVRSSRPADEAGPTPPSTRGSTPTPLPEPRSATPAAARHTPSRRRRAAAPRAPRADGDRRRRVRLRPAEVAVHVAGRCTVLRLRRGPRRPGAALRELRLGRRSIVAAMRALRRRPRARGRRRPAARRARRDRDRRAAGPRRRSGDRRRSDRGWGAPRSSWRCSRSASAR